MKLAWMYRDPECGIQRDEHGGTYVYPDTGRTLAEEWPEGHFQVPIWIAWLLEFTAKLHGRVQMLADRFAIEAPSKEPTK